MDENLNKTVQQLLLAFKSLQKSVEKSLLTGIADGTGATAIRGYQRLQARAKELMPDDFFITEVLVLDVEEDADDDKNLAQVNLLSSQAVDYLEGLYKAQAKAAAKADFEEIGYSLRDLGQEIQEQVMNMTRKTLKRAVANIDISEDPRKDPFPPMPPTPPEPPEPPQPPAPPYTGPSVEDPMADDNLI